MALASERRKRRHATRERSRRSKSDAVSDVKQRSKRGCLEQGDSWTVDRTAPKSSGLSFFIIMLISLTKHLNFHFTRPFVTRREEKRE